VSKIHRARRLALQGLCCLDVQGDHVADLVEEFLQSSRLDEPTVDQARRLLADVRAAQAECDEILAHHARHWDLGRLALVDRNILRLAVHELRRQAAPPAVIISEAVKLAQEFSTADSPRFVNGVLDAVAKDLSRDAGDSGDNKDERR
jgi:N utilization substance protein B